MRRDPDQAGVICSTNPKTSNEKVEYPPHVYTPDEVRERPVKAGPLIQPGREPRSYGPVLTGPEDNGGYPRQYAPIIASTRGDRYENGATWEPPANRNVFNARGEVMPYTTAGSIVTSNIWTNAAGTSVQMNNVFNAFLRFTTNNATTGNRFYSTTANTNEWTMPYTVGWPRLRVRTANDGVVIYDTPQGENVTNDEMWMRWNDNVTNVNGMTGDWIAEENIVHDVGYVCGDPYGQWVAEEQKKIAEKKIAAWRKWNLILEESREQIEARVAREIARERELRMEAEKRARKAELKAKIEKEARIRAELLLMDFLDDEQKKDLIEKNYFKVRTKAGNLYRICRGTHANVYRENEKGETIENLCGQPHNLPAEDVMLAQFLALRNGEEKYRKNCGISRIDASTRVMYERRYDAPPHRRVA